jgi:adenine-specific DNA-methyltransferase
VQQTRGESLLWNALRNRQLHGRKLRRQHPLGQYVVDFFCASERLVIEVDGPHHAETEAQDRERQSNLEALGFRLVRVTDTQVLANLPGVLNAIEGALCDSSPDAGLPLSAKSERGPGGEVSDAPTSGDRSMRSPGGGSPLGGVGAGVGNPS